MDITNVTYNPNTFTATLTIDTSDPDWVAGSQYQLKIKDGLKNPCGTKLAGEVLVIFSTEAFITGQVRNSVDSKGTLRCAGRVDRRRVRRLLRNDHHRCERQFHIQWLCPRQLHTPGDQPAGLYRQTLTPLRRLMIPDPLHPVCGQ